MSAHPRYPTLRAVVYNYGPRPTLRYPEQCIVCRTYDTATLPWIVLPCGHGGHANSCVKNTDMRCSICNCSNKQLVVTANGDTMNTTTTVY
jgi:hypothetical protein